MHGPIARNCKKCVYDTICKKTKYSNIFCDDYSEEIPKKRSYDSKTIIRELATVINRHSLENISNTPDYILAEYLYTCLLDYGATKTKEVEEV